MSNLHYTVESILSELASIITHNADLPEQIIECYEELQELSVDLDMMMRQTGMDSEDLSNEIYDIYQDMLDLYVDYLEEQSIKI